MSTLASYLAKIYHHYVLELQGAIRATLTDPDDVENLHKLRTTVRRIRTLLKAFKNHFEPDFLAHAKPFFKEIMEQTNEARDIDVFLQNFKNYKDSLPPSMRQWIEPLGLFLQQKRAQEYEKLMHYFQNSCFKEQLWQLSYPDLRQSDVKAKKGIKRAIKATKKELEKQKDLHRIRIVYKRLRYLTELLGDFEDVKKKIKRLKKVQDTLGHYHDLVVQRDSIYHFVTISEMDTKTLLAIGKLMGDLEEKIVKAQKKIKRKDLI